MDEIRGATGCRFGSVGRSVGRLVERPAGRLLAPASVGRLHFARFGAPVSVLAGAPPSPDRPALLVGGTSAPFSSVRRNSWLRSRFLASNQTSSARSKPNQEHLACANCKSWPWSSCLIALPAHSYSYSFASVSFCLSQRPATDGIVPSPSLPFLFSSCLNGSYHRKRELPVCARRRLSGDLFLEETHTGAT